MRMPHFLCEMCAWYEGMRNTKVILLGSGKKKTHPTPKGGYPGPHSLVQRSDRQLRVKASSARLPLHTRAASLGPNLMVGTS